MSQGELAERLDDCVMVFANKIFTSTRWMTDLAESVMDGMAGKQWVDTYYALLRLLFSLGFLGFSTPKSSRVIYLTDDPEFAEQIGNLEPIQCFHIHPAFRSALDTHQSPNK
jgi:hypothetical protein